MTVSHNSSWACFCGCPIVEPPHLGRRAWTPSHRLSRRWNVGMTCPSAAPTGTATAGLVHSLCRQTISIINCRGSTVIAKAIKFPNIHHQNKPPSADKQYSPPEQVYLCRQTAVTFKTSLPVPTNNIHHQSKFSCADKQYSPSIQVSLCRQTIFTINSGWTIIITKVVKSFLCRQTIFTIKISLPVQTNNIYLPPIQVSLWRQTIFTINSRQTIVITKAIKSPCAEQRPARSVRINDHSMRE